MNRKEDAGGRKRSQAKTTDAVFEESAVEIDQEANPATGELQVGEQLRRMHVRQGFDRLDLDDQLPRDHEIQAVRLIQNHALVADAASLLWFETQSA